MVSIQFAREPLTDSLWSEALPLLRQHWKEVAHFQDIDLSPDRDVYAASEAAGILRCFTARDTRYPMWASRVDGESQGYEQIDTGPLLGYALYFVRPNPHYRQSVQASQDVIYLDPSIRGGTGYKFIAWCDQQLASEGVQAVYQHVKAAHDFGRLLERQGYSLVDLIYAKRLDQHVDTSARATADPLVLHGETGTPHCASKDDDQARSPSRAPSTADALAGAGS